MITDSGVENILNVLPGVKVLDLGFQGNFVTDKSLKVLGNNMTSKMKKLEKLMLNFSETKITMEGVNAVFTGIPKHLKYFMFDLEKTFSDGVVALFEEKVCQSLRLVEKVYLKLGRSDLEEKIGEMLETVRKEAERVKAACELKQGNSC